MSKRCWHCSIEIKDAGPVKGPVFCCDWCKHKYAFLKSRLAKVIGMFSR